ISKRDWSSDVCSSDLKILQQYYEKCKFFLFKAIYIKGLKPFRVNQRCYPYIKIRKNRFFATLKNIKIKTKKHPFYRGAFFINSNQNLLFFKLYFYYLFFINSHLYLLFFIFLFV